jgi:mono/diheme cytochrome c family protein
MTLPRLMDYTSLDNNDRHGYASGIMETMPTTTWGRHAEMDRMLRGLAVVALLFIGIVCANEAPAETTAPKKPAAGVDMKIVERGRYLVKIAGCNDCHTPGYLLSEGKIPEKSWLTGDRFGWRGPWGTTYGSNLRLFMKGMTEKDWVTTARTLKRRPTMPWFNLNTMYAEDLQAIYQFVRYLGPAGEPAPAYVPPDREPKTPYALFPTPPKK